MEEMERQRSLRGRFEGMRAGVSNDDSGTPGVDKFTGVEVCQKCGGVAPIGDCRNCFHSTNGTLNGENPFEPNPEANKE